MKIGVIGLGLIGGSIFKCLRNLNKYNVIGISSSINMTNVSNDYNTLVDCDLVFVCTPMSVTLDILDKLNLILKPNAIVTDVCSLKEFVSNNVYTFKFIPSHPMAGTEYSGWDNSFAEMFNNAKWAITPIDKSLKEEQKKLENIIKEIGAIPVITTPKEHDEAVALISHLPLVIAQALCKNIKNNKLAQILASTGFKDTTRLALSNTQMALDMVDLNNCNIKSALSSLINNTDQLLNSHDYKFVAQEIKEFRQNLYH